MNSINSAVKIFRVLLENGQLDREDSSDLFVEYLNSEVQDALGEFEEEMECRIIKIKNTIYLLPNCDNGFLGFKGKNFKGYFGSNSTLKDNYLAYYITMFLLFKFYGGKNKNPKQREFIRVMTLIEELDMRFDSILSRAREEVLEKEEELNVNLIGIAELWNQKIALEMNKRTTKHGTVTRVCNLLRDEKLVRFIEDKKEIRTTKKLDDLMTYYFLNDSRIDEINGLFRTGGVE
ncbi:MAG: hypothetical protein JJE29_01080 [Peptostreptococcaceae bacterium]|nr:hypothetical protein [Peptostreptococcaceae bacterium]